MESTEHWVEGMRVGGEGGGEERERERDRVSNKQLNDTAQGS